MDIKERAIRLLNHFENDSCRPDTEYDKLYLYFDGPNKTRQVTLARGYTEAGSLWSVFQTYKELGGKNADKLLGYKKEKGKQTLPYNKEFLNLLISLGKNDELFQQAQDSVFDDLYWNKGLKFFKDGGFKLNLSLVVIEDSILHSGSILGFLLKKISEKQPRFGGNEKEWISEYCKARYNWLSNGKGYLPKTAFRSKLFLDLIKKNNWDFAGPLTVRGVKIFS